MQTILSHTCMLGAVPMGTYLLLYMLFKFCLIIAQLDINCK